MLNIVINIIKMKCVLSVKRVMAIFTVKVVRTRYVGSVDSFVGYVYRMEIELISRSWDVNRRVSQPRGWLVQEWNEKLIIMKIIFIFQPILIVSFNMSICILRARAGKKKILLLKHIRLQEIYAILVLNNVKNASCSFVSNAVFVYATCNY